MWAEWRIGGKLVRAAGFLPRSWSSSTARSRVILRTECVHLTVRGPRPDADMAFTHRWIDSWSILAIGHEPNCGSIRSLQLSSYPRRTFALRSGREASQD